MPGSDGQHGMTAIATCSADPQPVDTIVTLDISGLQSDASVDFSNDPPPLTEPKSSNGRIILAYTSG